MPRRGENSYSPPQGWSQDVGELTVKEYRSRSLAVRVNRSVMVRSFQAPWKPCFCGMWLVSTTRVSPSHQPTESPNQGPPPPPGGGGGGGRDAAGGGGA